MCSKRADADPPAGAQFKVLREASVVTKAGLLISGFRPGERIAGSQKSVFVECIESEIVSSPIAWSYAWALNPHFQFAVHWREFQGDTGRRQADAAGRRGVRMPVGGDETGLGRAQSRYPRDALADGFECKFVKRVADMLSDTCSGILQHPDTAEKVYPKRAVTTQPGEHFLVPLRNVEKRERRALARVATRPLVLTGRGFAVVDVHRPAIK